MYTIYVRFCRNVCTSLSNNRQEDSHDHNSCLGTFNCVQADIPFWKLKQDTIMRFYFYGKFGTVPTFHVKPHFCKNQPRVLTKCYSGDIKSGRMKWAGHVARMRVRGSTYRILVEGNLREIDRGIILTYIFKKTDHGGNGRGGLEWA